MLYHDNTNLLHLLMNLFQLTCWIILFNKLQQKWLLCNFMVFCIIILIHHCVTLVCNLLMLHQQFVLFMLTQVSSSLTGFCYSYQPFPDHRSITELFIWQTGLPHLSVMWLSRSFWVCINAMFVILRICFFLILDWWISHW